MKRTKLLLILLTLLAFWLRVWQLDSVPPGLRDDELINVLVISQKALDGDLAPFYTDASGHEGLYHILNAGTFALIGRNLFGLRALSIFLGTILIPMLYHLGRRLFNAQVGLVAATGLTLSFWGLMYSRIALRHIGLPFLVVPAFYYFWRGLQQDKAQTKQFMIAGILLGLSLYVYFAARGVPLILMAFAGYLLLFNRPLLWRKWQGFALTLGVVVVMSLPLWLTLRTLPTDEGRVVELAVPVVEARAGNWTPLIVHTLRTLNMFHSDGDPEWLYNIPERPIFSGVSSMLFWGGVLWAGWQAFRRRSAPHAFLGLWWLAGISPAFLSVPPASLSHTILAQPATYLLVALPLMLALPQDKQERRLGIQFALTLSLLVAITWRDLPDYFTHWPQRGNVRFLYHADAGNVADVVRQQPDLTDFGITGLLDGPWSRLALEIELQKVDHETYPRWYDPQRALLVALRDKPAQNFNGYPVIDSPYTEVYQQPALAQGGGYWLNGVDWSIEGELSAPICFDNGLCALAALYEAPILTLTWRVGSPLQLPPMPLISNPPPPGVYAGARLWVFAQMLDDAGNFVTGDDGLWVDPVTLQVGDIFVQRHVLAHDVPNAQIIFGLYDPMTQERILTISGQDYLALP